MLVIEFDPIDLFRKMRLEFRSYSLSHSLVLNISNQESRKSKNRKKSKKRKKSETYMDEQVLHERAAQLIFKVTLYPGHQF